MSGYLASAPPALTANHSILLDFDGTLVEIAPQPMAVRVDEALMTLLDSLRIRHSGRVAIVSGRSVEQLGMFLGGRAAGLTMIGSHGAEIRIGDGDVCRPERPPALEQAASALTRVFAGHAGVLVENKSLGVAVHYRLAPSAEAEVRSVMQNLARNHDFAIQEGKMMIELRLAGHDKGRAIAALLQHPIFSGYPPIFAGDDLTDEPGFAVCAKNGGAGVLVGEPRKTAALYHLPGVPQVRRWLAGETA